MTTWVLSISIAYLLGSIPFGYLLVRVFRRQDIRTLGSGNIGATNVARSGAKGLGIATLTLDLGKALAAVLLGMWLGRGIGHGYEVGAAAGIAAIVGHCFPVWLRFRGGKGVASGLGVFLALAPKAAFCVLGVFVLVFAVTRFVSLASVLAAAMFPVFAFYFTGVRPAVVDACFVLIPLLIIVKHHANIRRLMAGTENRFGGKKVVA